ncbi:MAG: DNRLRE domain-containing protein [Planctomycetota bacterium]|nr:DNRLRE domain-containing protein [Planctomycetota bacterium]
MRAHTTFGAVLAVGVVSASAPGASVTLWPSADNTLYESSTGATSNGAGTGMFAGRNSQASNSIRRGLVRFDVAGALPTNAVITGATLRLTNGAANAQPVSVRLHRTLESWGEAGSVGTQGGGNGGPAQPGDATWIHRFSASTLWSTAGGSFAAGASASAAVGGPGPYEWTGAGLLADVALFYAQPLSNFGWTILGDETASSTAKRFSTREEADAGLRPALTIEYSIVPGPGGVWAGLFGAVAAARRRRRGAGSGVFG